MTRASWYIDEDDPTLVRWHDGTTWTDYVLVRADWDGADAPPPPPGDPLWETPTPRGNVLRFAAGTAAVVLLVLVGALAVFGDGGSDDPAKGSTIGRQVPDDDRSTADGVGSVSGFGLDVDELGSDTSTADEPDDVSGSDGGSTVPRRSASSTTPTTRRSAVERTEFRSETHTDGGSQEIVGPRDDVKLGNSSNTTIATNYNPPPTSPSTTAAPTTTAPSDTTPTTQGSDVGTTGGPGT